MELNEYQEQAMTTCTESSQNFSYMMLNLVGEVGELASKVAKAIRKNETALSCDNNLHWAGPHPDLSDLRKEAGDILWQLAGVCSVMGWKLEDESFQTEIPQRTRCNRRRRRQSVELKQNQ